MVFFRIKNFIQIFDLGFEFFVFILQLFSFQDAGMAERHIHGLCLKLAEAEFFIRLFGSFWV